jgi:hypothetical protein
MNQIEHTVQTGGGSDDVAGSALSGGHGRLCRQRRPLIPEPMMADQQAGPERLDELGP